MLFPRHWFLILLALALGGERVLGASTREGRDFGRRRQCLQDGMWSRAEVEFAQFAEKYPESGRVAEALLMQSEADLKQGKLLQAVALLAARESQAGDLADQYVYWIGKAQFQNTDYAAAAGTFHDSSASFKIQAGGWTRR